MTDSTKFSLHLAWGGCSVMPSGWHSWLSVRLKRAKGVERNLSSLSLLSSSAHTFFFPEMWETSQDTEWAWDQEATRRRKRLSGQAVENSLFTPASVGVLSEPAGMAKERYSMQAMYFCASLWSYVQLPSDFVAAHFYDSCAGCNVQPRKVLVTTALCCPG